MTDWMALAADFLGVGVKGNDSTCLDESSEVLEEPTKLTELISDSSQTLAEDVHTQNLDAPEALTKLTKPRSGEVLSVLSVISERDEFEDRVVCTDCNNYRYGHCDQHIRAGIGRSSHVGSDLASLPQRCPAFEPLKYHP